MWFFCFLVCLFSVFCVFVGVVGVLITCVFGNFDWRIFNFERLWSLGGIVGGGFGGIGGDFDCMRFINC